MALNLSCLWKLSSWCTRACSSRRTSYICITSFIL